MFRQPVTNIVDDYPISTILDIESPSLIPRLKGIFNRWGVYFPIANPSNRGSIVSKLALTSRILALTSRKYDIYNIDIEDIDVGPSITVKVYIDGERKHICNLINSCCVRISHILDICKVSNEVRRSLTGGIINNTKVTNFRQRVYIYNNAKDVTIRLTTKLNKDKGCLLNKPDSKQVTQIVGHHRIGGSRDTIVNVELRASEGGEPKCKNYDTGDYDVSNKQHTSKMGRYRCITSYSRKGASPSSQGGDTVSDLEPHSLVIGGLETDGERAVPTTCIDEDMNVRPAITSEPNGNAEDAHNQGSSRKIPGIIPISTCKKPPATHPRTHGDR